MIDKNILAQFKSQQLQAEALAKEINQTIAPLLELQKNAIDQINTDILKQMAMVQPTSELLEEIGTSMATWSSEMIKTNFNAPALEAITKTATLYRNTITAAMLPFSETIIDSLKKLPAHVRKALIVFGEHGWYFDWEMAFPDIWDWESAFTEDRVGEAEEALSTYFESRLDDIEASIINKFSQRKEITREAFEAHRAGKYMLSIPVLFAQTDGICKEIFDRCLFKRDKKTFNAKTVEHITNDTMLAAVLSPLDAKLPVIKHRHLVMHGVTLNYGTKTNSLKAISLINYVACITEDE